MRKTATALRLLPASAALFLAVALLGSAAFAQTSGKIAGTVTDKATGEAIPGANIQVVGTNLGASSDQAGRYFILNVPPGTYTVRGSFIGYKAISASNIRVSVGQTASVPFALETTVVEGEEVVITAERPLVEKDLTMTVSNYSASELNNSLPVASVNDILETSPSVYRGFIRGGSKHETKYLVDGVDVSDPFFSGGQGALTTGGDEQGQAYMGGRPTNDDDNAGLAQSASSLQEVQVFAGTFNAEFPAATAGIVNIVTKEGGRSYNLNVFNRTLVQSGKEHGGRNVYGDADAYLAERADKLASTSDLIRRRGGLFTWTPDRAREFYNYDPADSTSLSRSHETALTLSGPLGQSGGFFLEGSYRQQDGALPFDRQKHIGASLKLHYNLSPTQKITVSSSLRDGGEFFNFVNWRYNPIHKYYMEGAHRYKDANWVSYAKYTNSLSSKSFLEVQVSNTYVRSRLGYPDDNGDGISQLDEKGDFIEFTDIDEYIKYVGGNGTYGTENGFVFGDTTFSRPVFFSATQNPPGWQKLNQAEYTFMDFGTNGFYITAYPIAHYEDFKRNKMTIKADFTSQVNFNNQIKAGVSFSRFAIDVNSLRSELGGSGIQYPTSHFHVNQYGFNPMEIAAYIQDKIEFEGLIVNIGARLDGFDNDTEFFLNEFDPLDEVREGGELLERVPKRGDKVGFNFYLSPRVGVSHPVTDNLAMHYAFGRFFQYPNYASLYTDYNFTDYAASPNTNTRRPDQDPVRSTNYEIGAQWSFAEDYRLSATAYYRDVNNTESRLINLTTNEGVGLNFFTTWGYSDARGIEVELSKRPGRWWGGRISYAHSYIKQSVAVGGGDIRTAYSSAVDSVNFARIDWESLDRFPSRERNILVTDGGSNILSGGYDRPHRVNGTLQLFFPADINATFIGEWSSGFYYQKRENENNDPFFTRNETLLTGPSTMFVNARLAKVFALGGRSLEFFVEARNLFNRVNIRSIANNSGLPGLPADRIFEIWEEGRPDGEGGRLNEPETDPEGVYAQPTDLFGRLWYLPMREVYFGLNLGLN